jgi:AraC-like DNA-binding protein
MSIAATLVDRARVDLRPAPESLRPFVGCFFTITVGPGAVLRLVPDGYASIWCEIRPQRPVEWFLRGPIPGPSRRRFRSSLLLVGVRLRPGVPHLLTSGPVDRLVGRRIRLTDAPWASELVAASSNIKPEVHLRSLERFLMERLAGASVHPAVTAATDAIRRTNGQSSVAFIADLCRVSPRHLTRLMRTWTGLAPKSFARIVRFQAALNELADAPTAPLASVATANGYFDQAHLSGEVARLAALSPAAVVRESLSEFSKTRCE